MKFSVNGHVTVCRGGEGGYNRGTLGSEAMVCPGYSGQYDCGVAGWVPARGSISDRRGIVMHVSPPCLVAIGVAEACLQSAETLPVPPFKARR